MNKQALEAMTDDELADMFEEVSIGQGNALLYDDVSEFNRLYDRLLEISQELKRRAGDRRIALTRFYNHRNAQVRLNAANKTLAISPEQARSVLRSISDRDEHPQAAYARSMLDALDEGRYSPT